MNKYEVAQGLFVGSKLGDINKELKVEMGKFIDGDKSALSRIHNLSAQRVELLTPRIFKGVV